jgi:hypothetical protein
MLLTSHGMRFLPFLCLDSRPSDGTTTITTFSLTARRRPHLPRCGRFAVDLDTTFGQLEDRMPTHGYEPTREAAMTAFGKSWRRK